MKVTFTIAFSMLTSITTLGKGWEIIPSAGVSTNTSIKTFQHSQSRFGNMSLRLGIAKRLGKTFYVGAGVDVTQVSFSYKQQYTNYAGQIFEEKKVVFYVAKPLTTFYVSGGRVSNLSNSLSIDYGVALGVGQGKEKDEYGTTYSSVSAISYVADAGLRYKLNSFLSLRLALSARQCTVTSENNQIHAKTESFFVMPLTIGGVINF